MRSRPRSRHTDAVDEAMAEVGTDADRLARLEEALGHHVAVLEALSARLPTRPRMGSTGRSRPARRRSRRSARRSTSRLPSRRPSRARRSSRARPSDPIPRPAAARRTPSRGRDRLIGRRSPMHRRRPLQFSDSPGACCRGA
jgi:hypothetical protein